MGILSKLKELTAGQEMGGLADPSRYQYQLPQSQVALPAVNPIQMPGAPSQPAGGGIGGGITTGAEAVGKGLDKLKAKRDAEKAAAEAARLAGQPKTT
jgi:hypothetical protein